MKRTFFHKLLLLPALAAFAVACDNDPQEETLPVAISIEPEGTDEIIVPAEGATITDISVVSNAPWTLAEAPEFCTVDPESGEAGTTVLTITVFPNDESPRSQNLSFIAEGRQHTLDGRLLEGRAVATLTITQEIAGIRDLAANGQANCYIVTSPGTYTFHADNQFNLADGLPVPPAISPASAGLVWQTVKGAVSKVGFSAETRMVEFEVAQAKGNAVIAVYDADGTVAWSWHIWMPQEEIASVKASSGYDVMNMNLGAMNNTPGDAASYGTLYQWGRKDPFPASETLTGTTATVSAPMYDIAGNSVSISNSSWSSIADNTIEYSISHPTVCLSCWAQYNTTHDWLAAGSGNDALWGNPKGHERDSDTNTYPNKGAKTCYDPCPAGWRVPPTDAFRHFTSSGGYVWTFDGLNVDDINRDGVIDANDWTYGWHFMINDDTPMYFPAAARFDGQYAMLMGSMAGIWGNYWGNAPYEGGTFNGAGFCVLNFSGSDYTASATAGGSRADAYSVRCVRE